VADLASVLSTVRDRIAKYQGPGIGEQDTKATLIVPVLRALGWDTEDLEDVKLEYKRKSTDNPVDYALVLLREPRLFIEAKALGARLDDHKWANQILAYATVAGVEWVALTDGNEYRLYNSHAVVPVEEKLFRTVRIDDPDSRPAETLGLLSKALLQDHLIDQYWKSEFVDRQVGDTLRVLFASETDPAVIRLVHGKLPTMSRADIKASLARLRPTFDFPVVAPSAAPRGQVSAARPAAAAVTLAEQSKGPAEPAKAFGASTPWRHVTLGQLIDAGLIRVPLDISRHYRGADLAARIESADRIVFNGTAFDSLSIAGGMGRLSVVGPTPGHPYPPTNGWTFWEFRAADGSRSQLDTLRRELHERKVVSLEGRRTG
jgi:hypothetical protein